jgi:hypothetical protein
MARMVPSTLVIRKPKPSEIPTLGAGSEGSFQKVQREAAERQPTRVSEPRVDASAEESGGF